MIDTAHPVHLLLVSGSTRAASTNSATLRTAAALAVAGVTTTLYEGLTLLPAFNPDDEDPLPAEVLELRAALRRADAVLLSTPEYAGALPGSLKNLLDWTVGGGELYGKPVAWMHVAAQGRGDAAHASLRTVLGYVGAEILEAECLRLPVPHQSVGPEGLVEDGPLRTEIGRALVAVASAVRRDRSTPELTTGDAEGVAHPTAGEAELEVLLRTMSPHLHDDRWVFTRVDAVVPPGAEPVVVVKEDEGLTLVLAQRRADELSLPYDLVVAWITLQVHSALEAVGLTAAVSRALAEAGISCNVVAGFTHDHLFVPYARAADAMRTLTALTAAP